MSKKLESTGEAINREVIENQAEEAKASDEKYFEGLGESELLAEYQKHVDFVKQQRKDYEDHLDEAERMGTAQGRYLGDDVGEVRDIRILQRIMDEQNIPYDKFK